MSVFDSLGDEAKAIVNEIATLTQTYIDLVPDIINGEAHALRADLKKDVTSAWSLPLKVVDDAWDYVARPIEEFEEWSKTKEPSFRKDLTSFSVNLFILAEAPATVLLGPKVAFPAHAIEETIADIPGIALFVIAQGLDSLPGPQNGPPVWLQQSKKLRKDSQLLNLEVLERLEKEQLVKKKDGLKQFKLTLSLVSVTLDLVESLCPTDLSINIDVIGEGGGTEVAGHPIRIPFNIMKWILAISAIACDECLLLIEEKSE